MSRTLLKEIAVCIAIATSVGVWAQMLSAQTTQKSERQDWPVYGGAPENTHYSALAQINRQNGKFDPAVKGWQPARGLAYWTNGKERRILAGVMNLVYALDADNGKPAFRWFFVHQVRWSRG
jgi:glucose dehydrogenase